MAKSNAFERPNSQAVNSMSSGAYCGCNRTLVPFPFTSCVTLDVLLNPLEPQFHRMGIVAEAISLCFLGIERVI